jgi:selenocysteine-specific elongation factor
MTSGPLTLGTAGHVDHGKTALVRALTGVETDRLPEERTRGLTIVLGFAPLTLPSGRTVSVVDVPGHERFVRTMVAGASGLDAFVLVVAADDGPMPQTLEHVRVLRALDVRRGVVAVTKADAADPAAALAAAAELAPGAAAVACSARTGAGLDDLRAALDRLAAGLPSRARDPEPAVLHVDRAFSVRGRGTVVTGTLWSGAVAPGDALTLLPEGRAVRVRGVQVHGADVARAAAGQRVAVNLVDGRPAPGDVLAAPEAGVAAREVLDCRLDLQDARHGERIQVHHGTRHAAARAAHLADDLWQLRLERPLLARDGDHVVVRRQAPPDTLGGGVVLDAAAHRHGRGAAVLAALRARRDGRRVPVPPPVEPAPTPDPPSAPTTPAMAAAAVALQAAGPGLLAEDALGLDPAGLRALRETGGCVRVAGRLYAHPDAVARVRDVVGTLVAAHGSTSLGELRDALGVSRRPAQAWLEHLDAARVTRRLPDDRRVLRRGAEVAR